jgi:ethanolamine utilization protein EutQ (cupin superfamily)
MPKLILSPTKIEAAGSKPKIIEEYIGRVNSNSSEVSIARMKSPEGWKEPGQIPEFNEYTLVLMGKLRVSHKDGFTEVGEGQAIITFKGEWIQYSTPCEGGAEYISVCIPAFSPDIVHRDN